MISLRRELCRHLTGSRRHASRGCREALTLSSNIYLAIEGIDGTGKTYVAKHIMEKFDFSLIQEPSQGPIGLLIKQNHWEPITDFFLFMADRSTMLKRERTKGNVVSDRSLYSSFAYQGYYLKDSFEDLKHYFDFFMETARLLPVLPSHVIVLFSDVDTALDRVKKRGDVSRFERKEYLQGVQDLYFELGKLIENVVLVDSNGSLDELYSSVDKEVTRLLQQARPL